MLTKSSTLTQNRIAPPHTPLVLNNLYFPHNLINHPGWTKLFSIVAAKSVTMCLTFVLLLSFCCLTVVLLLSYCCLTAVLLLSYCCLTVVLLLSYCCLTFVLQRWIWNKFVSAGQVGQHSIICTFAFQAWDSHSPATSPTQAASTLFLFSESTVKCVWQDNWSHWEHCCKYKGVTRGLTSRSFRHKHVWRDHL